MALAAAAVVSLTAAGCTAVGAGTGATARRRSGPVAGVGSVAHGWTGPTSVDPGRALVALSCPAAGRCVAIDSSGAAVVEDGPAWSAPVPGVAPPAGGPDPGELTCPSPGWCLAIHSPNEVATWTGAGTGGAGGDWGPPVPLGGAHHLQAVACAAPGSCVAIDGVGDGWVLDGSTWSSQLNAWGGATDIACGSPTSCVAAMGGMSMWNGSSWTRPVDVDPTGMPTAVSCATASFCMAVDTTGGETTWNGASWSTPRSVLPSSTADVSCADPSRCVAVGAGMVTGWNGHAWSAPATIDPGTTLDAVACSPTGSCTAADARGDVLVDRS